MSEEIIIDDIDVSECGFCCWKHNGNELIENYCAVFNNKCICNPQCYFKQLQRFKQENEKLKEKINKFEWDNPYYILFTNASTAKHKYKQALEEIREIAKFNQFYNPEKLIINGDIGQIQNLKMTEIYNKINEVLNDR